MGLDNGVTLHTKAPVPELKELGVAENRYESDFNFHYDICYWRKCWNIRREVRYVLEADHEYVEKCWLSVGEVKGIWWALNNLNDPNVWDDDTSIWTYEEIQDHLEHDLYKLEWLIHFMRTHDPDDYMVEFYDSY